MPTFEFVVADRRKYVVLGDGENREEAEADAIERFHRLSKSGDLTVHVYDEPLILEGELRK